MVELKEYELMFEYRSIGSGDYRQGLEIPESKFGICKVFGYQQTGCSQ